MRKMLSLLMACVLWLIPVSSLAENPILSVCESGEQVTVVTSSSVLGVSVGLPSYSFSTVLSVASRSDGTMLWLLAPTGAGVRVMDMVYYSLDGSSWTGSSFVVNIGGGNAATQAPVSTPTPTQTPRPTPAPTPTVDPEPWPEMSFGSYSVSLVMEGEKRVQSRLGPARNYCGGGGYKPYKVTSLYAMFTENGYVFVDMDYSTVGHRRLYFPMSEVSYLSSSTPTTHLKGHAAVTTEDITPSFGPGFDYDLFESAPLRANSDISVFFEENGYVFAEFTTTVSDTKSTREETIRCYLPADIVKAR